MFRDGSRSSWVRTIMLGAALLAYPCAALAQRGGGGGHIGGGTVNGGAMGSGGAATGLDVKDDLKDFHEALALQASSQQIVQYRTMLKSTESASAELQAILQRTTKGTSASDAVDRDRAFVQTLERARAQNTTFLQQLTDRQKLDLKETIKKLTKSDSDLAQQAKALAMVAGQQTTSAAQSLQLTLTGFHSQQLELGEEMSVEADELSRGLSFNIRPVNSSVEFASQSIAIITSGAISRGALVGRTNAFGLELTTDMSDLRQNIAEVLRAQLNRAERCGEQIAIQNASLTPATPGIVVLAQVHYERWACFGRDTNEMVEGNGTIEVKVSPQVDKDGNLRLDAAIGNVDAQGLVGDLLRSGALGETVRDKIRESVLSCVQGGSDYKALLPVAAQGSVTLQRAQFEETGRGGLSVVLDGDIQLSSDQVALLNNELKSGELRGQSSTPLPAGITPR